MVSAGFVLGYFLFGVVSFIFSNLYVMVTPINNEKVFIILDM